MAEVREAVDFCRYYADQAEQRLAEQTLPGPTGESNVLRLHGRGVFVCISPMPQLDGQYTVFGHVTEGLEVLDAISGIPANSNDFPTELVVIESIRIAQ